MEMVFLENIMTKLMFRWIIGVYRKKSDMELYSWLPLLPLSWFIVTNEADLTFPSWDYRAVCT